MHKHLTTFTGSLMKKVTHFGAVLMTVVALFINTTFAQTPSEDVEPYAIFTLNPTLSVLSKNKARMLYRGKIKRLQGNRIELSDWPSHHNVRGKFYLSLLGKDHAQMNAHWASLSFSGKARPPKEIKEINHDAIQALITWLNAKKTRIGYAPLNAIPENANVLYVVKRDKV